MGDQFSIGPIAVFDQSNSLMRAANSPPPVNQEVAAGSFRPDTRGVPNMPYLTEL